MKTNGPERQIRIERDPLGDVRVPADALYGAQTARARDNFQISRLRANQALIRAFAEIKQAAAQANLQTGAIARDLGEAIGRAAEEIIAGRFREQFDLDVFQAGAGTSYNMNVNEERGYMGAAELAHRAIDSGQSIQELLEEETRALAKPAGTRLAKTKT